MENILKNSITFIFSSVLIAEIVKSAFNIYQQKLLKKTDYMIDEITTKNHELNTLYHSINNCIFNGTGKQNINEYLPNFQLLINFDGYFKRNDYYKDGHIWNSIQKLCNAKDDLTFNSAKDILLAELALLHQYNSEKIKKEIQDKKTNFSFLLILIIISILHIFFFLITSINNIILFLFELFFMWGYLFFIPSINFETFISHEYHYKNKKQTLFKTIKTTEKRKRKYLLIILSSLFISLIALLLIYVIHLQYIINNINYSYKENYLLISPPFIGTFYDNIINKFYNTIQFFEESNISESFIKNKLQESLITELTFTFLPYGIIYLALSSIYIICITLNKIGEFSYEEMICKIKIEKNIYYIKEIENFLINARNILTNKKTGTYNIECERILTLSYIKLNELKSYINQCNKTNSAESIDDIHQELHRKTSNQYIDSAIKELKKISKYKPRNSSKQNTIKKKVPSFFYKKMLYLENKKRNNNQKNIISHINDILSYIAQIKLF